MEEILIANLTLDTFQRNKIAPLIVPQGDYGARVIRARITDYGKPVTVGSTATVSIVAERSGDGQAQAFSGRVNTDGTVTVPVTQWMLDVPEDDVTCHVVVTGSGYQYSTTSFLIEPQAKANPTEITPDDPRVDVITEVLANENARQAAEATRVSNENARKTAENARQSAETQRLTDEATRVANEVERVSAESSRDATFKGWAQDIASLPSFDARISANADRITNLESGIPSSLWAVDDSTAYVKDVPTNARPRAIINKIGGMTYKTENLIQNTMKTQTSNGVTLTVNIDGSITLSGTATSDFAKVIALTSHIPVGDYYLSGDVSGAHIGIEATESDGKYIKSVKWGNGKATIDYDGYSYVQVFLHIYSGKTFSNVTVYPMLNEGSTTKPYSPYFEGLRSAKVTAVKSVGRDLIPFPYTFGNSATHGGVTFSAGNNGSITVNGTSTGKAYCNLAIFTASNLLTGTYSAHTEPYNAVRMLIEAYNGTTWYKTLLQGDGTIEIDWNGYSEIRVMLYIFTGNSFSNVTVYPMLNKGSTAEPYAPYHSETLTIPAAVQALDGWGQGIPGTEEYNFLDWRPEDGVRAWHQICAKREYEEGDEELENAVTDGSSETVYLLDKEIVTDISDLLPADNLIGIEGGGTLTFENEYDYDMPNTVTYMLKEVTA